MTSGSWFLVTCVAAAFVLVVAGALSVLLRALRIKKRVDAYRELPVLAQLATTQAKLEATRANLETLPVLLERSRTAIASIRAVFEGAAAEVAAIVRIVSEVRAAVRTVMAALGR